MKANAIYARYSSHAQDDGTSIEVQLEQCERAAGAKCEHYIDRAKTGRAMGGRSELLRLLSDAEAGKIARVYVYKFDRLGRAADTHVIAQQLEDSGVELVSATEGTNALARGIQLVVAEDYSRQLAQRTRDGLLKRFEQNAFTGGIAPYGYRVVTSNGLRVLEVDPDEAGIVRMVVDWYTREAVGFKGIAKRMRERGIASRRGTGWSFTSVRCLLMNPMLTGRVRYNARKMHLNRQTGRRVPKMKAASEHMERHDEHLRIIDDETFNQIQQRIGAAARGTSPRAPKGIYPLTGLVYCKCGAKCYRVHSENRKGSYDYYVCSRHLRYDDCPHKGRVREDEVMELVQQRFAFITDHADEIIRQAIGVATAAVRSNRDEAARLKSELAAVEADQSRLVELLMDRSIADAAKATISRKLADAEARHQTLRAALDDLREDANDSTEELAEAVREVFEQAKQNLAAIDSPATYNRFVDTFIGAMEADEHGAISQKKTPVTEATGVNQYPVSPTRCIAGGGFEPPTSGL
jgi:DNA invertase Pin-like site-specific DNA recombinase